MEPTAALFGFGFGVVMLVAYVMVLGGVFVVSILITRWVFRVNKIVSELEEIRKVLTVNAVNRIEPISKIQKRPMNLEV